MSERIERMFRDYREMKADLELLRTQLRGMESGVSEDDVIMSMVFSSPDGEHVMSSGISDKTATIAMRLREEMLRYDRDMVAPVVRNFVRLRREINFFDYAVALLPGRLPEVVRCLVQNGDDWDSTMQKLDISRRTLQRDRRRAIELLDKKYELCNMSTPEGLTHETRMLAGRLKVD